MGNLQRSTPTPEDHLLNGDSDLDNLTGLRDGARLGTREGSPIDPRRSRTLTAKEQQQLRWNDIHRRKRWINHPWQPGEREALLAAYSGPITRCPEGTADHILTAKGKWK